MDCDIEDFIIYQINVLKFLMDSEYMRSQRIFQFQSYLSPIS